MDESVYKDKTVLYTTKGNGEDIGKKFVECLENDLKEIYGILKTVKPIKMSEEEELSFKQAEICYACKEKLVYMKELGSKKILTDDRVRDHCHLTGKYRGAAHSNCNLKMRTPTFVPVLFHNLEEYDSHLFVKSLGISKGNINCIPKTDEKYISFSKNIVMGMFINGFGKEVEENLEIRFLDSLKFTLKSLDGLVKGLNPNQFKTLEREMGTSGLLKKKRVFPYEYMTGSDKLEVNELQSKKDFYSKLNDESISDEQYEHAQNVCTEFQCKIMRDYHDLYLKKDVLLLPDVMENYRDVLYKKLWVGPHVLLHGSRTRVGCVA